jgi:Domain of unknown function (DUF4403)
MELRRVSARRSRTDLFGAAASIFVFILLTSGVAQQTRAQDAPPKLTEAASPMTAPSKISAVVEFSIPAIDRALEQRVPKRLATFDDRATLCWHRRILRREVDIDCEYSGYVERTGPISLRAEHGRLEAAVPIYGGVSGQALGRFARLLHGTADGALTVYASAQPRLRPDWTVALGMAEGFRWQEPPVLHLLGFNINLSRYVEPKVRTQLDRIDAEASAYLRSIDLRDKAETSWRHAFTAVKIFDEPPIWLQMTPLTAAFAGMHAYGNALEGALEIAGTVTTTIGPEPAVNPPMPLPPLGTDVAEPGKFDVIIPVAINYDTIRARIQDLATAMNSSGMTLRDVKVYPSGKTITVAIRIATADNTDGDWIYLSAMPKAGTDAKSIQFPDIAMAGASQSAAAITAWFKDDAHLQALQQQMRISYDEALNSIVASANARLTRSLGNGFRSEAHLTTSGVPDVQPLDDGLRADVHIRGDLKILYGL